jgi:hypothetical protein
LGQAVLDGASHGVRNDSPSRGVGGFGQRLGGGKDIVIKVKGGAHHGIVSDADTSDEKFSCCKKTHLINLNLSKIKLTKINDKLSCLRQISREFHEKTFCLLVSNWYFGLGFCPSV